MCWLVSVLSLTNHYPLALSFDLLGTSQAPYLISVGLWKVTLVSHSVLETYHFLYLVISNCLFRPTQYIRCKIYSGMYLYKCLLVHRVHLCKRSYLIVFGNRDDGCEHPSYWYVSLPVWMQHPIIPWDISTQPSISFTSTQIRWSRTRLQEACLCVWVYVQAKGKDGHKEWRQHHLIAHLHNWRMTDLRKKKFN